MSKVHKNNLEEIVALMDKDVERWRKEDQTVIEAAGWVVISTSLFEGATDTAYAVYQATGQIVEVMLDKNDDATNVEKEVLDALTTRVSTLEERWEKQKKDMGL